MRIWKMLAATALLWPAAAVADEVEKLTLDLLLGSEAEKATASTALIARGDPDVIPSLIHLMRLGGEHKAISATLSALSSTSLRTWREAMVWQEAQPALPPHPSFYTVKMRFLASIDDRFRDFFGPALADPDSRRIRFEEVVWGGVKVDGIPSLDNPAMILAAEAAYMREDDLVFGVEINGDARAYPLRIMGWHEMANDVVGGVPVALSYCTLCGSGILYETAREGGGAFVFGSSGLLHRSNKLMFDRQTRSLWQQFRGEPVVGPLTHSGIRLRQRPLAISTWADWRALHPDTRVLALETGHIRDYDPGVAYRDYFASPDLMFPVAQGADGVAPKDFVFGITRFGAAKAWPVAAFAETSVINDRVGDLSVVLIGEADGRTVRAYDRGDHLVKMDEVSDYVMTEDALLTPDGQTLPRVAGRLSYWFAWDNANAFESALYAR
ncbi:MAG: DUF3179 domain-containing protein [Pseudomonadota bacterium]